MTAPRTIAPRKIAWVDAGSGASGDMLLAALIGAGVPLAVLQEAVDAVAPEPVTLLVEQVTRAGFAATRCHVELDGTTTHRTWADVRALLEVADLDAAVRSSALRTFALLARAEATVHGTTPDEVHFHEVGALDAIADVVGVCAGLHHLALDALVVSPVAVGSGHVVTAHGRLPVPPPAVTELLRGVPSYAGPGTAELCTPTGAALLVAHATAWGAQPALVAEEVGVGAGGRDPDTHANVLRLLVGVSTSSTTSGGSTSGEVSTSSTNGGGSTSGEVSTSSTNEASGAGERTARLLETNVDDLDPRLWPPVIAALLAAGASDAWLTPILMKKGRPAHTLSVLVGHEHADVVRRAVFRHTTTLGLRESVVGKSALERGFRHVEVGGHRIAVKEGLLDGEVVNLQPEYEHVVAAATALGRPVKDVLAEAAALARGDAS